MMVVMNEDDYEGGGVEDGDVMMLMMAVVMMMTGTLSFPQQTFAELLLSPELNQHWKEEKELHTDLPDLLAYRGHSDHTV